MSAFTEALDASGLPPDLIRALKHPANRNAVKKAAALELARREGLEQAAQAERDHAALQTAALTHEQEMAKCANGAEGCIHWFNNWVWTYDPRIVGKKDPVTGKLLSPFVRFKLFPRQEELIRWVFARLEAQEQGAVPKSRDVGATYVFGGIALHQWLFVEGAKWTFASRKVEYVDRGENMDAIFPKIRSMARRLPTWMMPEGFNWGRDSNNLRFANPVNGAMISGEGGDDVGRGGRSTAFVYDEFAFAKRADAAEAALSGNTDVAFYVSSVNGMGNRFATKCTGVVTSDGDGGLAPHQKFRFHYTDDPRKTAEWIAKKRATMTKVRWASEFEIDFSASIEGICIPGTWVAACQELRRRVKPRMMTTKATGGLDVGAGGKGKSVFVSRNGPHVRIPSSRGDPDTTGTAYWGVELAKAEGCAVVNYDSPGVGVGVTSALNYMTPGSKLIVQPINTGAGAAANRRWPDGAVSADKFGNLKAELWWLARTAAQNSFELLAFMDGREGGINHDVDACLLLPSGDPESDTLAVQLSTVKTETDEKGKIVIETKKALAKRGVASPDYGDALVLTWADKRPRYNINALG